MAIWMGTSSRRRPSCAAPRPVGFLVRILDLVLVAGRVDFGQHVALFPPLIFFGQEANDVPGHCLRGDVDDAGLDKGVIGAGEVVRRSTVHGDEEEAEDDDQGQYRAIGQQVAAERAGAGQALAGRVGPSPGAAAAGVVGGAIGSVMARFLVRHHGANHRAASWTRAATARSCRLHRWPGRASPASG